MPRLPQALSGAVQQLHAASTQAVKRAMLRWGIVPPPFRATLDVTDRCNFRCPTCSKWRCPSTRREMDLGEWEVALHKLRAVLLLREVAVSGGEPLLRRDLLELLELAKGLGLRIVLISNGWLLERHLLQRLDELGVDGLTLSLNSLQPDVHDATRGTAGSWERIMQAIAAWRGGARRTRLALETIVMEENCGELVAMARFAQEQGLAGIMFQVLAPPEAHYAFGEAERMPPSAARWYEGDALWVRRTDVLRQQVDELLRLQRSGYAVMNPPAQLRRFALYYEQPQAITRWPCLGTLSRLYVDPYGDMRICYGYPPVGNILRDDPRQAWYGQAARQIRQASRSCARLCRLLNNNL